MTSGRLTAYRPRLTIDDVGRELETLAVTSKYFGLFGQSIRGRDFTADDLRAGAEPVAVISDRLWTRVFGHRAETIGAVVAARPFPIRIIGVAPRDFQGARRGERADLWIPTSLVPRLAIGATALAGDGLPTIVFARLRPGQTPADAKQRLLQEADERTRRSFMEALHVVPLRQVFGAPELRSIAIREGAAATVVAGLAALVLVAGCATIMALVLVHYERRRRELAVRVALGASRGVLVRELSAELAWIAAGGSSGALLLSFWSLRALPSLSLPGGVDLGRLDLAIDGRVLFACVATTLLTLACGGLMPIRRFIRADVVSDLTASGATAPRSSQRLRQSLLAVHVAATIVVLVAAGLFVRAVIAGFGGGPGFDVDRTVHVVAEVVPASVSAGEDMQQRLALAFERTHQLRERLLSLPGVEQVALGWAPIGPEAANGLLTPKRAETRTEHRELKIGSVSAGPEWLAALGVPVLSGRSLTAADSQAKPAPAVVTKSLADLLWPTADAVGQTVSFGGRLGRYTIVGVARDFAYGSLNETIAGVLVSVNSVGYGIEPMFVVRAQHPEGQVESIRKAVREIAPNAPRVVVTTGREIMARELGRQRLGAWFFSGFGLAALVLGIGGVFGLVAYLAESRRREFGVRLALGATPRDVMLRGMTAALTPVAIGAIIGLLCAAIVARLFVSLLHGLGAFDPATYTSVALLMMCSAAASGLAAAWRLRLIAPADALRTE